MHFSLCMFFLLVFRCYSVQEISDYLLPLNSDNSDNDLVAARRSLLVRSALTKSSLRGILSGAKEASITK